MALPLVARAADDLAAPSENRVRIDR